MITDEKKVVVVTGGARGIGKAICDAFAHRGDHVCTIDLLENSYYVGDLADEKTLQRFSEKVIADFGRVDILINNACLSRGGLFSCNWDEFNYVLKVGVTAPFRLTQLFLPYFTHQASIIHISSTRYMMSQPDTESYTAAKGAITSLTHAMAVSLAGKVRVNCIVPGWIDTTDSVITGPDAEQHPVKRVGKPEDIVHAVMFLTDSRSGFITGQTIVVDGGMTRQMIYHGEYGWRFEQE